MLDSLAWLSQLTSFTGTTYTWNYSLGDTVIGTNNYTKYSNAFLREDTINRKVYRRDLTNNNDILLYDFDLNVGDTFALKTLSIYTTIPAVCLLRDSVLTYSGYRDRWYLSFINSTPPPGGMYIYESFGSIIDPISIYHPSFSDPVIYSTCIYHQGIKTFGSLCPNYLTTFQFFLNPATCGECNGSASIFTTLNPVSISWTVPPFTGTSTIGLCALSTGTVTVIQPPNQFVYSNFFIIPSASQPVTQQINATQASCATCCDGSITLTNTSGVPPFTYQWTPAVSTTSSATGLCTGQYIVTVTDSGGCTGTDTIVLSFSTFSPESHSGKEIYIPSFISTDQHLEIVNFPNDAELLLYDVRGRTVFRSDNNSGRFDLVHLQTGMYLAVIRRGNEVLYRHKIMLVKNY
jgi:hypothetical protein